MRALESILLSRLDPTGWMSFETFMQIALYEPELGYYESVDRVGRFGDFYTSVSAGCLFGSLMAWHFARWVEQNSNCSCYSLIECGSNDGQFLEDFLQFLHSKESSVFERTQIVIVENSCQRAARQRVKLARFLGKIRWVSSLSDIPKLSISGVVFCNELLDAMPVRRLFWDKRSKNWLEKGVVWSELNSEFQWQNRDVEASRTRAANALLERLCESDWSKLSRLMDVLPEGFTVDVSEGASLWWKEASELLLCGQLITFDYGLGSAELLHPSRSQGTLRAYRSHQALGDALRHPGLQDLTAHVNWDEIIGVGEGAGLETLSFLPQGRWITSVLEMGFPISSEQTRQFQTIAHPDFLGHSFSVLVQQRS